MSRKIEIDKYNQRQYKRMIALIEDYKNGHIGIQTLVGDLEALILALENVTQDHRNLLLSHWGILEDVYAVALDKGMTELDKHSRELVADALSTLQKVINAKMALLRTEEP